MTYPFTEHATVLEGEVELTVSGGKPQRFAPGDSWFVKQGTEVEWKILTRASSNTTWRTSKAANNADNPRCPAAGIVFMHWVTDSTAVLHLQDDIH
jgi:uncharacterized cupin superfamily protein